MAIDMNKVKKNLVWDFNLDNEFVNRKKGYGFVIDLREQTPYLAVYHMSAYVSSTDITPQQPPQDLMLNALKEQDIDLNQNGLFPINQALRSWIEENLLQ